MPFIDAQDLVVIFILLLLDTVNDFSSLVSLLKYISVYTLFFSATDCLYNGTSIDLLLGILLDKMNCKLNPS